MRRICFGVNAELSNRRILVCRGGSIAMKPCPASSNSCGIDSITMPSPEMKSSCRLVTSTRSAWRTTAQNPWSFGSFISMSSTGWCHVTGRSARSTA